MAACGNATVISSIWEHMHQQLLQPIQNKVNDIPKQAEKDTEFVIVSEFALAGLTPFNYSCLVAIEVTCLATAFATLLVYNRVSRDMSCLFEKGYGRTATWTGISFMESIQLVHSE